MIDCIHHKDNQSTKETGYRKVAMEPEKSIGDAIKINEKGMGTLNSLIWQSVEGTINSLLDAEADAISNASS